jgi:hypothetical protein
VLRRCKGQEGRRDPVEVTHVDSLVLFVSACLLVIYSQLEVNVRDSLFEAEVLQTAETLLLCLPDTVDDVLYGQTVVSLTVAGITERHAWGIHLGDGSQGKMRRPVLDQDHVASKDACSVCATCIDSQ